ncbi:MAG: hypothetical protein AB7P18_21180 [Candidatus Binatia bacterium]
MSGCKSGGHKRCEVGAKLNFAAHERELHICGFEQLGRRGRQLAHPLGIRPESLYRAGRREKAEAQYWIEVVGKRKTV